MSVIMMGFKDRLKELRAKKRLTQEALASALGIPESTVRRYESSDDNTPKRERLEKIADYFGVSVDYLLGRTNDPSTSDKKDKPYDLTHEELRILEEMKKYPIFFNDLASDPSKIKKVIKMWEFIKEDLENDDDEEPED